MIPQVSVPPGAGTSIGQEKYGRQKEKKPKPTNDNFVLEPTEISDPYLLDIVADAARNNILAVDGSDDENFAEHVEFMSGSRGDDKILSQLVTKREKEINERIYKKRGKKEKIKIINNQNENAESKHLVVEINENQNNETSNNNNIFNNSNSRNNSSNQRERPVSKMINVMYHRLMNKSLADAMNSKIKNRNKTPTKSSSTSTQNTPTTTTTTTTPSSSSSKRKKNKKLDKIMSLSKSKQPSLGIGVGVGGIEIRTETAEAHEARMQRLAKGLAQIFLHQQKRKKKLGITKLVGYNGDGKLPRRESEKEKNKGWNPLESIKNVFRTTKS